MNIGDWVHTSHNMNKITGFIESMNETHVALFVTMPCQCYLITTIESLIPSDDTIWMDDIPTLIDLSLLIRDEEWFKKWCYELSLWKPVGILKAMK